MQNSNATPRTRDLHSSVGGGQTRITNDRRYAPRAALSLPIAVRGESPFNTQTFHAMTRDISAKGVYFVCDEAYMAGQLLHATIRLSSEVTNGFECLSLTLRFRVQRAELQISSNGFKTFGVAMALDE